MRIFLEAKFARGNRNNDLISIGAISEDGRTFYAELNDFDTSKVDKVDEDFINHLVFKKPPQGEQECYMVSRWDKNPTGKDIYEGYDIELRGNLFEVMKELNKWLTQFEDDLKDEMIEIWSDMYESEYGLYNNLFCRFFPDHIHRFPFDIRTYMNMKGLKPGTTVKEFVNNKPIGNEYLAIYDAKLIKLCYEELKTILPYYKGER